MSTEKVFLARLLFVLSSASLASAYTQVATFGTFGEGMLVHWRYPLPSTGSGSIALDFLEQSDLPLHIRPYYGYNYFLVLNSYINGVWGRQEYPSNFPFLRGTTNDVTVYTAATGFDIYANSGAFHYRYNYRTDVTQISSVTYTGTHQVYMPTLAYTTFDLGVWENLGVPPPLPGTSPEGYSLPKLPIFPTLDLCWENLCVPSSLPGTSPEGYSLPMRD